MKTKVFSKTFWESHRNGFYFVGKMIHDNDSQRYYQPESVLSLYRILAFHNLLTQFKGIWAEFRLIFPKVYTCPKGAFSSNRYSEIILDEMPDSRIYSGVKPIVSEGCKYLEGEAISTYRIVPVYPYEPEE